MIAYKFLSAGAIGVYSGFRWPVPENGEAGPWVHVDGPLVLGANGLHALTAAELVEWIDDELWLVELDGEIEKHDGIVLARRGRLVQLVEAWAAATAREFTEDCIFRVVESAFEALRRAGRPSDADALRGLDALDALQRHAVTLSKEVGGFAASALAYVADAVELARGGRPDHYGAHPGASAPASPGAIAANLGFVAAHVAASSLADATSDPGQYHVGFEGERERQRTWLAERVRVRENLLGP